MDKQPRGEFAFTYKDQHFKGKLGTWTLAKFSEKLNIPTITDLYSLLIGGMSLMSLAELLVCAVQYHDKKSTYTVDDAYEWIDEIGGVVAVLDLIKSSAAVEAKEGNQKKSKKH